MKKLLKLLPFFSLLVVLVSCNNSNGGSSSGFVGGDTISEYNKTSKFYFSDTINGVDLATYHAKNKGDVPYVNIVQFFETTGNMYSSGLPNVDGKTITFQNPDKPNSYAKFNALDNSIEFKNINSMTTFAKSNNGLGPDLALDATIYLRESNKTKIAVEGQAKKINLDKYSINIYEQGGKFYAPFEFLCNTMLSALNNSYTYNGKDFYQDTDKFTSTEYTSLCYSGEAGFLYYSKYSNGQIEYNALFTKVEPKSNEAYRFQTVAKDGIYSAIVLYNDGTGKLLVFDKTSNQEVEAKVEFNYSEGKRLFKYKKENNQLILEAYDVDLSATKVDDGTPLVHSLRINLDKTRFGLQERTQEVTDYNYGLLCLTFDYFYGVKEAKGIESFDAFFAAKGVKNDLKSKSLVTYGEALTKALQQDLNDAHTAINCLSVYGEPSSYLLTGYREKYESQKNKDIISGTGALMGKRFEKHGADPLVIVGDTAFISFDKFSSFGLLSGMSSYTESPRDYADGNRYNGLGIVCSALNEIANNTSIKNVVLDVTANTGGLLNIVPFIAGITTPDPTMCLKDSFSGQVIEFHYETRLNGDPDLTTLANKYNFFVLTSKYSFSCANALPTVLKGTNVKLLGQKGAGGTCPVFRCSDACGSAFVMSGIYNIVYKSESNYLDNENGVPVDIEIAEADLYDFDKIVTLIKK